MDENELKAAVGEAAFNAMTPEQRSAMMSNYAKKLPPKEDDKDKDKNKNKNKKDDEEEEEDEDDLTDKVRKAKEAEGKKGNERKAIETAVRFNLGVANFVKEHSELLPEEVSDLLKAADKETYDSESERANALKVSIIKSFFSVQDNMNLLTANQKSTLDGFFKLTKNGKEEKAEAIYENIFEPTLQALKQVRKAEELGKTRNGIVSGNKVSDGYRQRLIASSKKTHLGEKGN